MIYKAPDGVEEREGSVKEREGGVKGKQDGGRKDVDKKHSAVTAIDPSSISAVAVAA